MSCFSLLLLPVSVVLGVFAVRAAECALFNIYQKCTKWLVVSRDLNTFLSLASNGATSWQDVPISSGISYVFVAACHTTKDHLYVIARLGRGVDSKGVVCWWFQRILLCHWGCIVIAGM